MKNKLFTAASILFSVMLLASCSWFFKPVDDYFDYCTNEASINTENITNKYVTDPAGNRCFNYEDGLTATFQLQNPQHYSLILGYAFDDEVVQNYFNAYYKKTGITLIQSADKFSVTLTFSSDFLKKIDEGNANYTPEGGTKTIHKDISGSISLQDNDSSRYFDSYKFSARAESTPPVLRYAMLQRNGINDDSSRYVVCFYIQNFEATVHAADTKDLYIGSDHFTLTWENEAFSITPDASNSTSCSLSTDSQTTLLKLSAVTTTDSEDVSTFASLIYSGYTAFYYTTNICPESTSKTLNWKIKLQDDDGLSVSETVSNTVYKLQNPVINVDATPTVDEDTLLYDLNITVPQTATKEDGNEVTVKGTPVIYYTVEQGGTTYCTGSQKAPAVIQLPSGQDYSVTAYAKCTGYVDSDENFTENLNVYGCPIYYVSSSGDDLNTGSKKAPFRKIQQAIGQFNTGISKSLIASGSTCTIRLMSDLTPVENFNDNIFTNFTAGCTYVLEGYNGTNYTIDAQGGSSSAGRKVILNNTDLTIRNLTITGGYSVSDGGAGIYNSGNLKLENVTVKGNKISLARDNATAYGAGIYNDSGATITISGKNTITGNTITIDGVESKSNLYLPKNDDKQTVIAIDGALTGGTIGISTASDSEVSASNQVTFTSGYDYGTTNKKGPGTYFTSDTGKGITYNDTTKEAVLAVGGGGISLEGNSNDGLVISADVSSVVRGGTVTFEVKDSNATDLDADIISSCTMTYKVLINGDEVLSHYTLNKTANTITFDDTIPYGTYTILVTAAKSGTSNPACAEITVKVVYVPSISELTEAPTSSTNPLVYASTGAEIAKLSGWVNGGSDMSGVTIQLTSDLSLPDTFTPIGEVQYNNQGNSFNGTFDGNNKTISNLKSTNEALFGSIGPSGTIKNLTVEGAAKNAGIVYCNHLGTVENCTNKANITGEECGVIAYYLTWNSGGYGGTIKNCTNEGTVTGTKYAAGIVCWCGYYGEGVFGCINNGEIKVTATNDGFAGGIAADVMWTGSGSLSFFNNINNGSVETNNCSGGIIGHCNGAKLIANNLNNGSIKGQFIGGICGTISNCTTNLYNNVNLGSITETTTNGTYYGFITGMEGCNSSYSSQYVVKYTYNYGIANKTTYNGSTITDKVSCFDSTYAQGSGTTREPNYFVTLSGTTYTTTEEATIGSTTSTDLLTLLNAWIDNQESSSDYKKCEI